MFVDDVWVSFAIHPQCGTAADTPSPSQSCCCCQRSLHSWKPGTSWRWRCRRSAAWGHSTARCPSAPSRPLHTERQVVWETLGVGERGERGVNSPVALKKESSSPEPSSSAREITALASRWWETTNRSSHSHCYCRCCWCSCCVF